MVLTACFASLKMICSVFCFKKVLYFWTSESFFDKVFLCHCTKCIYFWKIKLFEIWINKNIHFFSNKEINIMDTRLLTSMCSLPSSEIQYIQFSLFYHHFYWATKSFLLFRNMNLSGIRFIHILMSAASQEVRISPSFRSSAGSELEVYISTTIAHPFGGINLRSTANHALWSLH